MNALNAYAAARAPVPPLASGVVAGDPNQRQRFFVELAPGETTIVSWKTLVQEANNEVVADDSSDEEEDLEDYIQLEKSRIKEGCSIIKRDIVQHKSGRKKSFISLNVRNKTMRKVLMDCVTSTALQKLQELKSAQHDLQSRSLMRKNYEQEGFTNIKQRNNKGRNNLPHLNLPYTEHAPVLISHRILILFRFISYHLIVSLLDQCLPLNYSRFAWSAFYEKPVPLIGITSNNTRSRGWDGGTSSGISI